MDQTEQTLIIFKPEAVERKICWKLLKRWEEKGYSIVAATFKIGSKKEYREHYSEHKNKNFYVELVKRMTRGPSFILVLEGPNIIAWSRKMIGTTNPQTADIGTIRGDYGISIQKNIVHASDSKENASREIRVWFPELYK
jgi:nucleoside-diphosphate kinase